MNENREQNAADGSLNNLPLDKDEGFFLGKKMPRRLIGIVLILLGAIGFTNYGFLGTFIAYAFTYCFGVFMYLLLGLLIILGLFMLAEGKWPKFRANFSGLGYVMLFVFGCIASSIDIANLSLSTFGDLFSSDLLSISDGITINSLLEVGRLHGGFIGYVLTSVFLTGVGKIGTTIFTYLFLVIGSVLVLRPAFTSIYHEIKDISARSYARKASISKSEKDILKESEKNENETQAEISPFKGANYQGSKEEEKKQEEKKSSFFGIPRKPYQPSENKPVSPLEKAEAYQFSKGIINSDQNSDHAPSPFSSPAYENNHLADASKEESKPLKNDQEADLSSSVFSSSTADMMNNHKRIVSPDDQEFLSHSENDSIQHTFQVKRSEAEEMEDGPDLSESELSAFKGESSAADRPDNHDNKTSETIRRQESVNPVTIRYMLPSISMLTERHDYGKNEINASAAREKIPVIDGVFQKLHIGASVESFTIGPSVTRFNIKREPGVRVSAISSNDVLSEMQIDLRGDMSVRIEEVVRGQDSSGVEIGNPQPTMVSFYDCYGAILKKEAKSGSIDKLLIPLGEDISSEVVTTSLDSLPHLLIAGTTGSGKSVFIHSIIMTLIMRNYPDELKLILIDPKQVEFSRYSDLPHLYCPIVTNVTYAVSVLKKLVGEMERRFGILARYSCSKIQEYNKLKVNDPSMENLPVIVCIIDEFADMMGQDPKNVDALTQRLAQKARAAGIYLIISTQRPSVKCITGTIKSNIPARIALYLPSQVDSRTILDEGGAEALLGKGDLLARIPSLKSIIRLQSAYVSDDEVRNVVTYLKSQAKPSYNQDFLNFSSNLSLDTGSVEGERKSNGYEDELYGEIRQYVIESRVASTSSLQRRFQIGYGRAANILDALEDEGVIKSVQGNRKEVVATADDIESDDGSIGEMGINTGE